VTRDEEELRAYLGERFDRSRLVRWQEQLEEEAREVGDEARLYRTSEAYLYNLTAFAMTGTKAPYLDAIRSVVAPGARLLDVGCGIGSDGLALLEDGYAVEFADFDNPSTRYLRWRLSHRGLAAPVHDLDAGPLPGGFDLAYAFDVLEHVGEPLALLGAMERGASLVCVNLLAHAGSDDSVLHRALPLRRIAWRARRRRIVLDRRLHEGRVRLLIYGAGRRRAAPR
jgi:2-polyprenyl-3-methyl-5-hydroxy-6-metoxy-1,4-benzoquinol methylase